MVVGENIGHLHDRAWMLDYFHRHDEEVRRTIPKDRLLVYQASEGWEPLCRFLGVPIPDAPFPSVNSREEFKARVAKARAAEPSDVTKLADSFKS
jgi:hypothetical protein